MRDSVTTFVMDRRQKRITSWSVRGRRLNLNVRVDAQEVVNLRALAEDRDASATTLIRPFAREACATRFGDTPLKRAVTRKRWP